MNYTHTKVREEDQVVLVYKTRMILLHLEQLNQVQSNLELVS